MFKNKQPIYKVQLRSADKILEGVIFALLVLTWTYVYISYQSLPATIPTHFDGSGKVDDMGDKSTVWMLPAISTVLYLFITLVNNFPQIFNYLEDITPDNVAQQYTMATRMVRFLKLIVVLVFGSIVLATIYPGNYQTGIALLPLTLSVLLFLPGLVFFLLSSRKG
ncbi:MAG: DUF1648 domain-containing protein [Sphingobacteriaceae bacterium]|nr:DUF1648 domain-containing protein [Sphingobacteriaceae bacterium]